MLALAWYYWMVTIDEEVEVFWNNGRLTGATVLSFLNRYIGLLCNTLIVVQYVGDLSNEVRLH